MPYPPSKWTHFTAVLVCWLAIIIDALLWTKQSQTSYNQPHKSIIHGVLKAYNLFRWAQNRMVNQQGYPYLNKLHVQKVWSLSFPLFCFVLRDSLKVSTVFDYIILRDSGCFFCFPLKIFARKPGRGRPELIPSRTADIWPLCYFKAQPPYHVGYYAFCSYLSGYRFKLQSLLNITRYVVSLFRKLFLWFLTYAPRLHREGGTIFVSDQLLQGVNEAVNLRVYCQSTNELALIMVLFFHFRYGCALF